jgi:hypothetical protein
MLRSACFRTQSSADDACEGFRGTIHFPEKATIPDRCARCASCMGTIIFDPDLKLVLTNLKKENMI